MVLLLLISLELRSENEFQFHYCSETSLENCYFFRICQGSSGLKRIFGLRRVEVIGSWRKMQNEELHNSTPHQVLIK
jgi:hypothetical protein